MKCEIKKGLMGFYPILIYNNGYSSSTEYIISNFLELTYKNYVNLIK